MDFKEELIDKLREYDPIFANANAEDLQKGHELSLGVEEFSHPENYMTQENLLLLSQFYQYAAIQTQIDLQDEPDAYVFDEEDLDPEDRK